MWEGIATYNDIDKWKYSNQQIKEMHQMLDLKDDITRKAEASHG